MKISTALFTILLFTGCNEKKVDIKAEGEKLMQISRDWSASAATGNMDTILGYWADDAVVMSPGQAPVAGKKAIREMLEGTTKVPGFRISWAPLNVTVSKSGDMAYMIEQNQITVNDSLGNPVTEYNKSVTIWRKVADGTWKNVVDMWNADPSQKK